LFCFLDEEELVSTGMWPLGLSQQAYNMKTVTLAVLDILKATLEHYLLPSATWLT
jgi:hypothetical protein